MANRFFDTPGDISRQLSPWECKRRGLPITPWFELQDSIRFRSDIAGGVITVDRGFVSDLASIPQFAWSIFMRPDDPRIELGAWIHDLLYKQRGRVVVTPLHDDTPRIVRLKRKESDAILAHEAMPELTATRFQQTAVYQALRRLGEQWEENTWTERFT